MILKPNTTLMQEESLNYNNSDNSDENFDEEGDLEIDLDYNKYDNDHSEEPLDLSMKSVHNVSKPYDNQNDCIRKAKLPTIDNLPTFNFSVFENNNERLETNDNKGKTMTEQEVSRMLDPYVKSVHKKFSCTVCDMKFVTKVKAVTHVENKHVDCLQYKCPLCRASKGTRLAYESHLRRGHGAKVAQYSPHIRCKKQFLVKSEAQSSKIETEVCQPYDLQFVTFLRHILSMGKEVNQSSNNWQEIIIPCADWVDQEQSIFRINNRQEFCLRWYKFKVCFPYSINSVLIIFFFSLFRVSRLSPGIVFTNLSSLSSSPGISLRSSLVTLSSKSFVSKNFFLKEFYVKSSGILAICNI